MPHIEISKKIVIFSSNFSIASSARSSSKLVQLYQRRKQLQQSSSDQAANAAGLTKTSMLMRHLAQTKAGKSKNISPIE